MVFPYKIIEFRISKRTEFDVTDGYQPTYALFYLKKGSFHIELDGVKEEIYPGDCLILPDYIHFRRNVIDPIEFVYVKFAWDQNCPYSLNIPYGKVTFEDKNRFSSNILVIEQLITRDDIQAVSYREHLLNDILFQIAFDQKTVTAGSEQQVSHNNLVSSAITYIQENIAQKILVEDVCRAVGSNSSTLNFNFRRELNMSIGQFIMSQRMKKARRFLMGTTYSISDIATRCGFENVYYFSNAFKKMHGLSPAKYKCGHE